MTQKPDDEPEAAEQDAAQSRAESAVVAALKDHVMVPLHLHVQMMAAWLALKDGRLVWADRKDAPPPAPVEPVANSRLTMRSIPPEWQEVGARGRGT